MDLTLSNLQEALPEGGLFGGGGWRFSPQPLRLSRAEARQMMALGHPLAKFQQACDLLYRRSAAEAPARAEEIHHAHQEGVDFQWLTSPLELLGDTAKNVRAMRCERMELGEPDSSGRRRPVAVPGSEFEFECDMVVFAIGTNANPILGQTSGLKLDKRGYIATDEHLATSIAGVYAGGDIVTGAATVIQAMGAGRKAARGMKAHLGLRDTAIVYQPEDFDPATRLFGIARGERNFAPIHLA